jgi:hypothetical protein
MGLGSSKSACSSASKFAGVRAEIEAEIDATMAHDSALRQRMKTKLDDAITSACILNADPAEFASVWMDAMQQDVYDMYNPGESAHEAGYRTADSLPTVPTVRCPICLKEKEYETGWKDPELGYYHLKCLRGYINKRLGKKALLVPTTSRPFLRSNYDRITR